MDETQTSGQREEAALGVFVGSFVHNLDPKKRLTIPAEWRDQIAAHGGRLYVLPGVQEPCLYVFPARVMAQRLERIRNHSIVDSKARQFIRAVASRSDYVSWDVQGRIRIKDDLLEHAHLQDQVTLVGAFERFELWAPQHWRVTGAIDHETLDEAARYVGF